MKNSQLFICSVRLQFRDRCPREWHTCRCLSPPRIRAKLQKSHVFRARAFTPGRVSSIAQQKIISISFSISVLNSHFNRPFPPTISHIYPWCPGWMDAKKKINKCYTQCRLLRNLDEKLTWDSRNSYAS